ncbi:hypothetical protein V8F06_000124 [Rhypophila decipiens]
MTKIINKPGIQYRNPTNQRQNRDSVQRITEAPFQFTPLLCTPGNFKCLVPELPQGICLSRICQASNHKVPIPQLRYGALEALVKRSCEVWGLSYTHILLQVLTRFRVVLDSLFQPRSGSRVSHVRRGAAWPRLLGRIAGICGVYGLKGKQTTGRASGSSRVGLLSRVHKLNSPLAHQGHPETFTEDPWRWATMCPLTGQGHVTQFDHFSNTSTSHSGFVDNLISYF